MREGITHIDLVAGWGTFGQRNPLILRAKATAAFSKSITFFYSSITLYEVNHINKVNFETSKERLLGDRQDTYGFST